MSRLLKNMLMLSAAMAACAGESPYSQRTRGSYFDAQVAIRSDLTEKAEEKAIKVFGKNAKQLLLGAPIKGKTVMAYSKKDAIIRLKHQNKRKTK